MSDKNLKLLRKHLHEQADPEDARFLMGYFKTGPGQYAEKDIFIGVRTPALRRLAKEGDTLPLADALRLLQSPVHEERLLALFLMIRRFRRADESEQEDIFRQYMEYRAHINNWDLIDLSAPNIPGAWLLTRSRDSLYALASSASLWDRRIAIVSTLAFIRTGELEDTFHISSRLLGDSQDLIHKACGWMLRECGKRDLSALRSFLKENARRMPRTMLRYSIEKLDEEERRAWMAT